MVTLWIKRILVIIAIAIPNSIILDFEDILFWVIACLSGIIASIIFPNKD